MTLDEFHAALGQTVPIVATMSMECLELDPHRAVIRLPDQQAFHNHVGGPHAGALFTLAESAAGALIFANFAEVTELATPLVVEATIHYKKLALGSVIATATMTSDPSDIIAAVRAGNRPEFTVDIKVATNDGTVTSTMTALMTLRPNRAEPKMD